LKVAVSSTGPNLDATVSPRFGRCPYFVIVETATMGYEAIPNSSAGSPSGAGIAAAQEMASRGVGAVLTGRFGPNASQVLSQVGVKMVMGASGTVRQAVEAYMNGDLNEAPSIPANPGMGYDRGMGGGRGARGGRGMGRGMGIGMGFRAPYTAQQPGYEPPPVPTGRDEEKEMLKRHLTDLELQLKEVKKRLEEFK
jgi:predicted Fe-Mo cluster-binding NifX family protein